MPVFKNIVFPSKAAAALAAWLVILPAFAKPDRGPWNVTSPDGKNRIEISLNDQGELSYRVSHRGRWALQASPLGLRRDDESFERDLSLIEAGPAEKRRETYELFSGNHSKVDSLLTRRSIKFGNAAGIPLVLDLAVSSEGVAFRYRFPETNTAVRLIQSERTGFVFPSDARGWMQPYHTAGQYTPAYEDYYYTAKPTDMPSSVRSGQRGWAFPLMLQSPGANTWLLVTESGTDGSYCGTHLSQADSKGVLGIAFPAPDEGTGKRPRTPFVEPRSTLPWTMPWRVIVLGDTAADIAMATLVTDVAEPSRIADTSWIKPGRSSWSWWSYPEGPNTAERYDQFTDLAAKMGWEYTLFDGGWWEAGLRRIDAHARSNGVASIAWSFAGDFYGVERRARKLDELASEGARGVKIDFWCSDRQDAFEAMHGLMADAAARKMVVDLHGCTLPRGWHRTWPNLLTAEAVVGTESYFYEKTFPERAAELNTILPFTRNAVGPMDYTPVAVSLKKYPRRTTAAHELATALVFTSGLVCYSDKPELFKTLPPAALAVLRDAPARWDESRCLIAEPGRAAVFARRSGTTWYLAGLNGTTQPRRLSLDLTPFGDFKRATLVSEAPDAAMNVQTKAWQRPDLWRHTMPAEGGFILRLDR